MITRELLMALFDYDPSRGVFVRKVSRRAGTRAGDVAGSVQSQGYLVINIEGRTYKCHRLAWLYVYGEFPAGEIDHINGDKRDNRIENLRQVTRSENTQNARRARSDNALGVLGVTQRYGKYAASITLHGKQKHLGYYDRLEDASAAYLAEKRRIHITCSI